MSGCPACAQLKERGRSRMSDPIHCVRCHRTWTGMTAQHCVLCHQTFASLSAADIHRAVGDPCVDLDEPGWVEKRPGVWTYRDPDRPPPDFSNFNQQKGTTP